MYNKYSARDTGHKIERPSTKEIKCTTPSGRVFYARKSELCGRWRFFTQAGGVASESTVDTAEGAAIILRSWR